MSTLSPSELSARPVVEWPAIFAGIVITTASALVLLAFGGVIGLSMTSPFEGEGMHPFWLALAAGVWLLWVQLLTFGMGGYVAARLRQIDATLSEHETEVRDGLHGLLVWGGGVIVAAILAASGLSGAAATARMAAPHQVVASVSAVTEQVANDAAAREAPSEAVAETPTQAERRAEIARKFSIIAAFITAASLLAGGVAAFLGAGSGGHHRDKRVTVLFFQQSAAERYLRP